MMSQIDDQPGGCSGAHIVLCTCPSELWGRCTRRRWCLRQREPTIAQEGWFPCPARRVGSWSGGEGAIFMVCSRFRRLGPARRTCGVCHSGSPRRLSGFQRFHACTHGSRRLLAERGGEEATRWLEEAADPDDKCLRFHRGAPSANGVVGVQPFGTSWIDAQLWRWRLTLACSGAS